jgi:glycosyltransferase involved in cell wall biosynthesis
MPKIIISTTNDISTDNRVNKVALLLLDLGFDVLWVGRQLKGSPSLEREYKTHRFNLFFTKGALFYAEYNIRLFFFLLTQKSDVLLSNDLDTLLANFMVSRLKRKELVYDTHEYFLGVPEIQDNRLAKSVWTFIEKWIFPQLKTVFTVNNSIANLYEQDYGTRPKVFRNISPVVLPEKRKTREELGLPLDKKIVINQGSGMNVDRGIEEAFEAILKLEDAVLLLVGSGDVIPKLKAMVKEQNAEDKVIFVDRVPYQELLQYTLNADVGISLDKDTNINYRFSLPNKLFDYIHCGIPVVCSNVIEVKTIVDEYRVGKSIEKVTPEPVAKALEEVLIKGKTSYQDALRIASKELTWEKEKVAVEEVYKNLISKV